MFDIMSCVHANVGSMYAIIQQFVPRAPGSSIFGGMSVGQWIYFRPVRAFAFVLGQELSVPYPRYELTLEGSERTIFTVSPVTAYTFFGIALSSDPL